MLQHDDLCHGCELLKVLHQRNHLDSLGGVMLGVECCIHLPKGALTKLIVTGASFKHLQVWFQPLPV